jgi:flagellar biosynthesis chaperone FliJ
LEKAKKASEELKESLESYDKAIDKLKTLTKGTEEYKNAL